MDVINVRDKGWNKVMGEIKALDGESIKIGFDDQSGTSTRTGEPYTFIAWINEFGGRKVVSRPFLRNAFDNMAAREDYFVRQLNSLHKGSSKQQVLMNIARMARREVQQSIRSFDFEPNADYTIQRKGFDFPLVETGEMANRVSAVVGGKHV